MPVRRDKRTGRWFFRATVKRPDGTRERIFGTPGTPGPFHDLAPTKVGAQEAERRAIAEVMTGKPAARPAPERKEIPTIQSYATETFLETYVPTLTKPSARRSLRQILAAHVLPAFGALRIDEIRQEHVDAFVTAQKDRGLATKTINNRLSALSRLLRYAVENGVVPPARVRLRCKIAGMVSEVHAVPLDQVERLLALADVDMRVVVLLATEAGLRAGEIRGLQWGDVRDGQITVRRALDKQTHEAVAPKHNKTRTVPLSDRLAAALAAVSRRGLWVVSKADGSALGYQPGLLSLVRELYQRAEVTPPVSPVHCLRHTFGTVLAAAGVPLPVLQKLMGHSDVKTTRRYITVGEDQKRAAIASAWQWRGSGLSEEREGRRK